MELTGMVEISLTDKGLDYLQEYYLDEGKPWLSDKKEITLHLYQIMRIFGPVISRENYKDYFNGKIRIMTRM